MWEKKMFANEESVFWLKKKERVIAENFNSNPYSDVGSLSLSNDFLRCIFFNLIFSFTILE